MAVKVQLKINHRIIAHIHINDEDDKAVGIITRYITLWTKIVAGRKSCESCEIFLATLIQKVAGIKCCKDSFSKKSCKQ